MSVERGAVAREPDSVCDRGNGGTEVGLFVMVCSWWCLGTVGNPLCVPFDIFITGRLYLEPFYIMVPVKVYHIYTNIIRVLRALKV